MSSEVAFNHHPLKMFRPSGGNIQDMGKPFMEDSDDLYATHTKNIADAAVNDTMKN